MMPRFTDKEHGFRATRCTATARVFGTPTATFYALQAARETERRACTCRPQATTPMDVTRSASLLTPVACSRAPRGHGGPLAPMTKAAVFAHTRCAFNPHDHQQRRPCWFRLTDDEQGLRMRLPKVAPRVPHRAGETPSSGAVSALASISLPGLRGSTETARAPPCVAPRADITHRLRVLSCYPGCSLRILAQSSTQLP